VSKHRINTANRKKLKNSSGALPVQRKHPGLDRAETALPSVAQQSASAERKAVRMAVEKAFRR